MNTLDLIAAFNLPPEQAIQYLRSKGIVINFDWQNASDDAKIKSFWITDIYKADLLQTVKDQIDKSLQDGLPFSEFKKNLLRSLSPENSEQKETILNRMRVIFQTNLQTSLMAAHYKTLISTARYLPYWKFIATLDKKSSPICPRLHGIIAPYDSPFWDTHFPPLHFNCRSNVIPLTVAQAQAEGITPPALLEAIAQSIQPAKGFNYNPGKTTFKPDLNNYHPRLRQHLIKSP